MAGILFRKSLSMPVNWDVIFLHFSRFRVLVTISKFVFCLKLFLFVLCRWRDNSLASIIYMWLFSLPERFEKAALSAMCIFIVFAKKWVTVAIWVYIRIFCSIPLVCVCLCASTMLFLLLWFCNIIWNQVWWYLYAFFSPRVALRSSVICEGLKPHFTHHTEKSFLGGYRQKKSNSFSK